MKTTKTTTPVAAPAQDMAPTPADRMDIAEQALAKAEAALNRLRSELRSIPPRVRAGLEEAADAGEPGRAAAEEHLLALVKRSAELPALVALAEAIAAGADLALRTLEQEVAREAYRQARAKEHELKPPPGVFFDPTSRAEAQRQAERVFAAARHNAAEQAKQSAAERFEKARQRRAAALAVRLD